MNETPTAYFEEARTAVRVARRETVDERGALDQFCQRVERLPTAGPQPERAPDPTCAAVVRAADDGLSAVRRAYETTVMAVPHHENRHDVSFVEHVAAELGSAVATALRRETALSSTLKTDLLEATQRARERRVVTVRALDEESASLERAEQRVRDLLDALADESQGQTKDATGGKETDADSRLAGLQERCDEMASARRSTLADPKYGLAPRDEEPTADGMVSVRPRLSTVYDDLPVRDPVLATLASLGQLIAERRARLGQP